MREWKVAIVMGGILLSLAAGTASAQVRRARANQNEYQGGQNGQTYQQAAGNPQAQGYQQGQQYQRASQQPSGERHTAQRVSGQGQGANSTDQQLANWLLVDNRGEIQLARLAEERASCDNVKDFAKKLIDEHSQMVEELQQFAGIGRGTRQESGADETANERGSTSQANARGNQQNQQANAPTRGSQQVGSLNLVRLKQQLGQQCLASAEQELEQKDGDEFDKCFIGMQLAKHMEMLDTLKVFSRYASPHLDQLIEQAEQTTQDHLDHAKHLMKQLESGDSDQSSPSSRSNDSSSSDGSASDKSSSDRSSSSDRDSRRNRGSDDDSK